jgi:hypothetical protein
VHVTKKKARNNQIWRLSWREKHAGEVPGLPASTVTRSTQAVAIRLGSARLACTPNCGAHTFHPLHDESPRVANSPGLTPSRTSCLPCGAAMVSTRLSTTFLPE